MFTLKKEWNRQKLVDSGYASENTARMMMVYQVHAPEDVAFDPSQDKLTIRENKLFCGVCLTQASRVSGIMTKSFAVDDFVLRFKGPLDAESKHLGKCPECGSLIQICGGLLETPAGPEPIITLYHQTAPSDYLMRPSFQIPQLTAKIERVQSSQVTSDESPTGKITERENSDSVKTQRRWWKFWKK